MSAHDIPPFVDVLTRIDAVPGKAPQCHRACVFTQQPIACDLMTKKTFILSLSPIQRVHIRHALENSVIQMKQNFHTVSPRDQDLLRIMIRDQTNMQRMFS